MLTQAKTKIFVSHRVPKYSQHLDVKSPYWQRRSCAVISLIMVMEFYGVKIADFDAFIKEYNKKRYGENKELKTRHPKFGWYHQAIINIASEFGFQGERKEFDKESPDEIFSWLEKKIKDSPIMASVYKEINPAKGGGHLLVITGVEGSNGKKIYFNDPDVESRDEIKKEMEFEKFLKGCKKRFIIIKK